MFSSLFNPEDSAWYHRHPIFNDNSDLHYLIRKRLVLRYLTVSFHPSFTEECSDGLLMALQKQDGGLRPILSEEIWRRYFASLAINESPVRNEAAKIFSIDFYFHL